MSDPAHRRQLATFLRSKREGLTPVEMGLLAGPRRRTPGLRREEVALLSGVSVTWYTWLEQARDIRVRREVLGSIGRALRLTPAERRQLFGLAGQPLPPDGSTDGPAQPPSPTFQRLVDALDPNPAYLLNVRGDLLVWNSAEAGMIGDPGVLAEAERNVYWLMFTDPAMRRMVVDWRRQALGLLAQYRVDAAMHPGDAGFDALTGALRRASADFRQWWDNDVVADFQPPIWQFEHPRLGLLSFDYLKLAAHSAPETRLVTALPADTRTADLVGALAATELDAADSEQGPGPTQE